MYNNMKKLFKKIQNILCFCGLHDDVQVDLITICRNCKRTIPKNIKKHRHLDESVEFYLITLRRWKKEENGLYSHATSLSDLPLRDAYEFEIKNNSF